MRMLGLIVMAGVLQQLACAQAADPLVSVLATLAADARDLHDKLPSFECRESFTSQSIKGGKTKQRDTAEGTVRVQRGEDGQMVEHFTASTKDGKPVAPEKLHVPFFVIGGFADALDMFLPKQSRCLNFSLMGARLEWKSRPDATASVCEKVGDENAFALLDKDGHVLHTELSASKHDLEAVELNGHKFWVTKQVSTEVKHGDWMYQWEATYTSCRLFAATVKLLPGGSTEGHSIR